MCSKNMNPTGSMHNWTRWHHDFAADPLGLGLHDYSGDLVNKVSGSKTYDELQQAAADRAAKKQQAFLDMQYAPLAPEKSAMEIGDPAEIRNRRRQAVLLGVNQLKTSSGPGVASGGADYSGLNGGLS